MNIKNMSTPILNQKASFNSFINKQFVTIDSENTKDIDDALYVEKNETGYRIAIAIANPVGLVQVGSTEDEQARLLGATVYIRDKTVHRMLPSVISEHKGSLIAGRERQAVVFDLQLSESMERVSCNICLSNINVVARLSHSEIPKIVGDADNPMQLMLSLASTLARLLLDTRRQHGALALYDLSRLILTDEEGKIQILHSIDEVIGYIIVQEMMILANHEAAKWMIERNIPCLFRNHEPRLAAPRSDELAFAIESWIKGAAFDINSARNQFSAIAGKAKYSASAKGHYGLSLPAYLHISSPLRRYADLVNMRQLVAHIKERPLPYDKETLAALGDDLNEAIERRKDERSEQFKNVVKRNAEAAIEEGRLNNLADHELRQALKISKNAGYIPNSLAVEVARRFEAAIATEVLANSLLAEIPHDFLTKEIRTAIGTWLFDVPSRAAKLINYGQQIGFIAEYSCQVQDVNAVFSASATLLDAEGNRYDGGGIGSKKRDAEQVAATIVLSQVFGFSDTELLENRPVVAHPISEVKKNLKAQLIELCQKHKWPIPSFEITGKGPSHMMIFGGTVKVGIAGVEYVGKSAHATTKKDAEAIAAGSLLDKISHLIPAESPAISSTSATNPVGAIQEFSQKGGFALPTYEITQLQQTPPIFRCTVTTFFTDTRKFIGEGSNKQTAKTKAAAEAIVFLASQAPQ